MAAKKSQEASSFNYQSTYHVFLSFRGEDTRKTFTDHLYAALNDGGFHTFMDDDGIERGENIKPELEKAIQESRISIIVFSRNYASSTWCLEELVMILKRRPFGHVVLPVFYDVDPSDVRKQIGSFKDAFMRLEQEIEMETGERRQELKGKVEEWRAALREVANLAGMNLQNLADGHESRFIRKIIKVVGDKLRRTVLDIAPFPIGMFYRAKDIQHCIEDGSIDVGIVAICGMGGIGKTTVAKFLYNLNSLRFEGSSFIANVREISKRPDGLLSLQRQLLSDILRGRKVTINSVDEGIVKIKEAMCCKRILVVLDDVDNPDQVEAILGMRDWLFPGSRIVITTRRERLLRAHEVSHVQRVEKLDYDESLELFSWHAFGQSYPIDGYLEVSKCVVRHCDGLPLAIKVLGSSLSGRGLDVWKSQLEKLKAIPDSDVLEKLKVSYDSLQDDHDKNLFLYLACFFAGSDKDCTITILDRCEFYTLVGIQNLIDRCLVTINEHNMLEIHQLLQDMGREIARRESPKEPGERSILCNHKDSFDVLRDNTGTNKTEGLVLDMKVLNEVESVRTVFGANRKRRYHEFLNKPLLSNLGNSLKRQCHSIFSFHMVATVPESSNQLTLEADAFARMCKLKILQLNHVQISGPYGNFPKGLRWLSWGEFSLKTIPCDFPLDNLVALEVNYSNLNNVWERTKYLPLLKILDLSHSSNLAKTPDFSGLPNLERLMLENCVNLVEVHESIAQLERLVLLNLKDCKNLRRLPRTIGMLKLLEKLDISGCSNLEQLPTEFRNMESLTVLHANSTSINRLLSTTGEEKAIQSFIRPWLWKPKSSPVTSWASLPWSLVELSVSHCKLSEDSFPSDIRSLSSLNFLDLSHNLIRSLPDCIKALNGLQRLYVNSCFSLQTLVVFKKLQELVIGSNDSLEKITFPSASDRPNQIRYTDKCDSLLECTAMCKVEPIGNVDAEILNHLGLSNLEAIGNPIVQLYIGFAGVYRNLPLQGCHESHVFCTYLPGSKVPPWYNFRNTGSSISFKVPSLGNLRIRGLSVCFLYRRHLTGQDYTFEITGSYNETSWIVSNTTKGLIWFQGGRYIETHTIVSNTTKGLIWSHLPRVFAIPEDDEYLLALSYWKFENQLEGGDELDVSVIGERIFEVKEVGVHIVYEEQENESTESQSTSEDEEISKRISAYGNVVPGNASPNSASPKLYQLGYSHGKDCKYCPRLVPQPRAYPCDAAEFTRE